MEYTTLMYKFRPCCLELCKAVRVGIIGNHRTTPPCGFGLCVYNTCSDVLAVIGYLEIIESQIPLITENSIKIPLPLKLLSAQLLCQFTPRQQRRYHNTTVTGIFYPP